MFQKPFETKIAGIRVNIHTYYLLLVSFRLKYNPWLSIVFEEKYLIYDLNVPVFMYKI